MYDLWYKDAVVYSLDIETFQDANGDGIGDFNGLTERLEYLAGLGVTCLWLLPFFPTPNRDNGYDVTDYYAVDPRLGTLGDFVEFMHRARERGLRVIIDLPVNHTSVEHPWFQSARQDPASPFRDFYVWSEERPENAGEGVIFPGVQEEIWTWDEAASAYYLHRFYRHQPDLNIANPAVREEIRRIMGFWLELGVSGFRVDAAPFLIELKGIRAQAEVEDPFEYLREFRDFLQWRRGDAIMIAEANVAMDEVSKYFGDGTRVHMMFNFMLNQHLFLAFARRQAAPLVDALRIVPPPPRSGQWAIFVRNHDELDLSRLSEEERGDVFRAFAPEAHMRLYDRGIRRRLPPMLGGDERRVRLAYSLMLSLPGTPVLRYGQEIGMGDDLSLNERMSVRTAMQWSASCNAGFSVVPPDALVRPVIDEGAYRYEVVNVANQRRTPDSLLRWIQQMLQVRRGCREIGWGTCEAVGTDHEAVFAHRCTWQGGVVLAVHNLGEEACTATLEIDVGGVEHLVDLLDEYRPEPLNGGPLRVQLEPYGFRWFRIADADPERAPHRAAHTFVDANKEGPPSCA